MVPYKGTMLKYHLWIVKAHYLGHTTELFCVRRYKLHLEPQRHCSIDICSSLLQRSVSLVQFIIRSCAINLTERSRGRARKVVGISNPEPTAGGVPITREGSRKHCNWRRRMRFEVNTRCGAQQLGGEHDVRLVEAGR